MPTIKIGPNDHGQDRYRVAIGTGTAWLQEFHVYAYNATEAVDRVADYCEENLPGLCADYHELADLCETGETVDEYAEANNLICCGNHGVYIALEGVMEIG